MKLTLREWQKVHKNKQNLIINASATDESDSPQSFPIGLCYHYVNYENLDTQIGMHTNTVLCAIQEGTDKNRRGTSGKNRSTILKTLSSNGIGNKLTDPKSYYESLSSYKFIVSPEGNGIDCHRHYEALIAGCIPIVENNNHIKSIYGDCPILYTNDYSEITPEYLDKKYAEMMDKTYDFSKLFISSYPLVVKHQIHQNSAFWTRLVRPIKKKNWWSIK
jgi:hypothetical protein